MAISLSTDFLKRRWLDFRTGHSTYLIFAMAFFQFVIITYALAIERFPVLKEVFPSMSTWAISFVLVYLPSAIIIGHFHLKKQIPTEAKQLHAIHPFTNHAAPGKELLLNIPAAIIGYEKQLKSMRIHNQFADALNEQFGIRLEKWGAVDFNDVERLLEYHQRLLKGESITEIAKS